MSPSIEKSAHQKALLELGEAALIILHAFCEAGKECLIERTNGPPVLAARITNGRDDGDVFPFVYTNVGEVFDSKYEVHHFSVAELVRIRLAATGELVFDRGPFSTHLL